MPVDPNSKGLVAYLSCSKEDGFRDLTSYSNTVVFRKGTDSSTVGDQGGKNKEISEAEFLSGVEWEENLKFPAQGLEHWN